MIKEALTAYQLLDIRQPIGRDYAFLSFPSHHVARTALSAILSEEIIIPNHPFASHTINWAKGRSAEPLITNMDCWFCLASSTLKLHLLVTVGSTLYLALPRGVLIPGHCLIIPIDCIPNRLHWSLTMKEELTVYTTALATYYQHHYTTNQLSCELLLFERAIRSKNSRDHMQLHCLPLTSNYWSNSVSIFEEIMKKYSFTYQELSVSLFIYYYYYLLLFIIMIIILGRSQC
jgi:hypothetical protein